MLTSIDVTVVIPARNSSSTIAATIHSIATQAIGKPHIIVVDDGSTDETPDVARSVGAQVLTQTWQGPGAARNLGVSSATSELIAFCDADDTWPEDRLREDLAVLDSRPDIDLILGRTRFDADEEDLLDGHFFDSDERTALIPHFGAATMRRNIFDTVGLIDGNLRNYEDYDWFLRVRETGIRTISHDRVALHRRIHRSSTSRVSPGSTSDLLGVLQQSIHRRRSLGEMTIPQLSQLKDRNEQ